MATPKNRLRKTLLASALVFFAAFIAIEVVVIAYVQGPEGFKEFMNRRIGMVKIDQLVLPFYAALFGGVFSLFHFRYQGRFLKARCFKYFGVLVLVLTLVVHQILSGQQGFWYFESVILILDAVFVLIGIGFWLAGTSLLRKALKNAGPPADTETPTV